MVSIADLSDEPKYTIKAACNQIGIRPVTLRAWERRYNLVAPHRSDNRYRLYSERDIAIIQWVKNRIDQGVAISSAAQEMRKMLNNGIWPEVDSPYSETQLVLIDKSPKEFSRQLYDALTAHDEGRAGELMRSASVSFDLRTLCVDIITPMLVEIGEAWYAGKIRITTEHFASTYVRGRLLSLMQTLPIHRNSPRLLLGCAPTEHHEIGSLMISVLLRSKGYQVEFLGPDVPLDDLVEYIQFERSHMLILTSTMVESAEELRPIHKKLKSVRWPPIFGYGGSSFRQNPKLCRELGDYYLGETIDDGVAAVQRFLPLSHR
jgi:DNA-binding transcriptional MerR regulator/methylmalonyl-CoA mutase cobalamin-binding subunit